MLDELFAMYGPPETIVSGNGTQFISKTFAGWCNAHSITHLLTAPFHQTSIMVKLNGLLVLSNRA